MTSEEKTKFRRTKIWKDYTKYFLDKYKYCCFCGAKATLLHHKYQDDYTLLEDDRFLPFCNADHRMCHRIGQKKNKSKPINDMKLYLLNDLDFGKDWINLD